MLRVLDRCSADEDRLSPLMTLFDLLDDSSVLCFSRAIDQVGSVLADHGLMGRDDYNVEVIDFVHFLGLCEGSTCHTRKLFVQAEEVLEGDGCQRMILALYR